MYSLGTDEKNVKDMTNVEMVALVVAAKSAGKEAVDKLVVVPMVVIDGDKEYFVGDGVCGFAWINIKPGNSRFAKFLKRKGIARTDVYYGGVTYWVSEYNQSMQKKAIYSRAFADVLIAAGVKAYCDSRID